jgi:DNA (cytosine-5)-methyltransferase 1
MLKVLDLFSGIGGFSLGLERTGGFQTVAFCEIEPYCQAVLRKHWPEVPIYDDVRKLSVGRLAADGIEPDVICGGFPCQDISVAGKGEGIEGERSGLWSEFARLIGEIRPRFAIVENVAALLSRGMDVVLGDLSSLRYDAEWHCIPASAAGAPHRRDRVWIVAYPQCPERWSVDSARHGFSWANSIPQWTEGPSGSRSDGEAIPDAIGHELRQQPGRRSGSGGTGEAKPGNHGTPRPLADAYTRDEQRGGSSLQMGWGRFASQALADGDAGRAQWSTEPDVGRVAHGVPRRVDRLGGLGNAVVPQIPEIIGNAILAAHSDARLKSEATRSDVRVADCRDACLTHNSTRRAS